MTRPSPLPNRITPLGDAVAVGARGAWTGNRGVIHRRHEIVKRCSTDGWVCCLTEFQGRRRKLMQPGRWTELFFLDEATAFAAGHRPCFFCRRADAIRFAEAWAKGQGRAGRASAPEMDAVLKRERAHVGRWRKWERRKFLAELAVAKEADLAPGVMIAAGDELRPYLFTGEGFLRWSFEGYAPETPEGPLRLLTPASAVAAFRAGYAPEVHPSAGLS